MLQGAILFKIIYIALDRERTGVKATVKVATRKESNADFNMVLNAKVLN